MLIIRAAFWLSVVVLLIPGSPQTDDQAPRVTVFEAVTAASAAVTDMTGFCGRNPDVCTTGGAAFRVFADKVRNGTHMLYDFFGKHDTADVDNGTLKQEDIDPPWRGPRDKAA
jgi:Family of unknown function (DUF5330)